MTPQQAELVEVGPVTMETLPDRQAWLDARRSGIGGSDAPVVMGVSPWKTPLQLYCEKLEIAEPDQGETEAMEWGLLLEPVILAKYERVTGRRVTRPEPWSLARSRTHPFMVASFDGLILVDARGPGGVQAKTAGLFKADEWEEEPPLPYQVQCQHEMAVAGAAWWSVAVLLGGQRFRWLDVPRNDRFVEALIAKEAEFMRRLQDFDPPSVDGTEATRELLRRLYPKDTPGLVVNLPPEAAEWDQARLDAIAAIKRAEAIKTEAENQIKGAIGDAEVGILPNLISYSWKTAERAGYTVQPTITRTLRRKEPK